MNGEAAADSKHDIDKKSIKRGSRRRTIGITALSMFAALAGGAGATPKNYKVTNGSNINLPALAEELKDKPLPIKNKVVQNSSNLEVSTGTSSNTLGIGSTYVVRNFNPYPEVVDTPVGAELSSSFDGRAISPLLPKRIKDGAKVLVRCFLPDPSLGEISGQYVLSGPGAYSGLTVPTKDFANSGFSESALTDIQPLVNVDTDVAECD